MANKSRKLKQPPMRVYVRFYPEHDLTLMAYLRDQAKTQDRPVAWILKDAVRRQMEGSGNA